MVLSCIFLLYFACHIAVGAAVALPYFEDDENVNAVTVMIFWPVFLICLIIKFFIYLYYTMIEVVKNCIVMIKKMFE